MGNLEKSVIEVEVEADSNSALYIISKNSMIKKSEFHVFGDASTQAYGSAIYLYLKDTEGNRTSHLVIAKSRVALSIRITLPRLELLASYITARPINYGTEVLSGMINEILAWSDSKIALSWIRENQAIIGKYLLPTWMERIHPRESIQTDGNFIQGTRTHAAGLVRRGISVHQLFKSKLWWHGPLWLTQSMKNWQTSEFEKVVPEECLVEANSQKKTIACNIACIYVVCHTRFAQIIKPRSSQGGSSRVKSIRK